MDLLNAMVAGVVSLVVSTIVSYVVGPSMTMRQEAAKADSRVRSTLRRIVGHIVLLLEHELKNREALRKGMGMPINAFLKPQALDELFWRLIRTAEDPRLDGRKREKVYRVSRDIMPGRFEMLRKLPSPPRPSLEEALRAAVRYPEMAKDLVAAVGRPPTDEQALGPLRNLVAKLRRMEELLEK